MHPLNSLANAWEITQEKFAPQHTSVSHPSDAKDT
nr:hypothetical protein [Vibrio cholerae]